MKKLSIVVPVYFNEANLGTTVPRLLDLERSLGNLRLELVFVDDGSGDRSLEMLLAERAKRPDTIRVVKLTRNFGSMAAIQAGLEAASGDAVAVIAADLQDPPELLADMARHWENGVKAVFAVRARREESYLKGALANAYYALIRKFALKNYPPGGFDFMLVDRQVVEALKIVREKNTNVMALVFWLGYPSVTIPYVRQAREAGKSRWTLTKKVKLFVDSFVAFSYVPIRALSTAGLFFFAAAIVYAGVVLWRYWTVGVEVRGWTALMIVVVGAAGLQMLMLGVLGEYLWRTLDETRRRPAYVVDEVYE